MADMIGLMVESRPPTRKRRRVVISCFECHRRKQKVKQRHPWLALRLANFLACGIQCDRELPCGNCIARNREASCAYEAAAPTSKNLKEIGDASATSSDGSHTTTRTSPSQQATDRSHSTGDDPTLSSMAVALGYSQTRPSTLSLLRTIETADQQPDTGGRASSSHHQTAAAESELAPIREKYKGLVRQLPAKTYVDRLVGMYFKDLHHVYNFLDQSIFSEQLDEWNRLPFALLSTPERLPPRMRFFPALLFQILATALLLLPPPGTPDPVFDALKYAGGMTFENLATDYSESGAAIVNLFGKSALDEVTVQAQFIRALFQKYTAHVIECVSTVHGFYINLLRLGLTLNSGTALRRRFEMLRNWACTAML